MVLINQDGAMMRINIALTAIVLSAAVVIVISLICYFVPAARKIAATETNIPKTEAPINYQLINIPGSDNCENCHAQPHKLSQTDKSSAASHGY